MVSYDLDIMALRQKGGKKQAQKSWAGENRKIKHLFEFISNLESRYFACKVVKIPCCTWGILLSQDIDFI